MRLNYRIGATNLSAAPLIGYYLQNVTNPGIVLIKYDRFFRRGLAAEKKSGKDIALELLAELDALTGRLTNEVEYTFAHIKPLARNFVHAIRLAQCYESQVSIWL
jgi:hypothetical protein